MEINQKIRIGMLTPSSNSIVEPWCYKIIGTIENTSVHFGRVEVLWICLLYTSPSPRDPKTSRMPSTA